MRDGPEAEPGGALKDSDPRKPIPADLLLQVQFPEREQKDGSLPKAKPAPMPNFRDARLEAAKQAIRKFGTKQVVDEMIDRSKKNPRAQPLVPPSDEEDKKFKQEFMKLFRDRYGEE
jgi:hypothetical protein